MIAQKVVVGKSVIFYVLKHAAMYEETMGNIRVNSLEIIFAYQVLFSILLAAITVLYVKAPKKQHIWHCEVIPLLLQFDGFIHCFDVQNLRYRTGDFDMARILMMRYFVLLVVFAMVANGQSQSLTSPIMSAAMLGIGSVAGFTTYTSEITKRGDPVKIPAVMLYVADFIIPPLWIWWSRYLRYVHVKSIL